MIIKDFKIKLFKNIKKIMQKSLKKNYKKPKIQE